jgi:hypothetical protein
MKTPLKISGFLPMAIVPLAVGLLAFVTSVTYAQESRDEVPGDHFSLEGALELFKKSASPEEFEKHLNTSDNRVNNLDLNGDGQTDYIKVIDRNEGSVHAFILQAIVSETEAQDVAVIELEKLSNGKAVLQIVGDSDIYGIETIIEPTEEVRVNAGATTSRNVVNVWAWPSVQYVYSPHYVVWVSPWRWTYHPFWWNPWRPVGYYAYYSYWQPYRPYYSICHTRRVVYAQRIYRPYRTTSVVVINRHRNQIDYRRSNRDIYESRNRGYHDARANSRYASNDSRYSSGRSYTNERSSRSDNNSRPAGRTYDNNSRSYNGSSRSTDVRRRSESAEQRSVNGRSSSEPRSAPNINQRSTSEQRAKPNAEQRSSRQRELSPSNQGRSNPSVNRTPDVQRRSTPSVGRDNRGNSKPTFSPRPSGRESGASKSQRSGGAGNQGGGERKRGRN